MIRSLFMLFVLAVALQGAGACSSDEEKVRGEIGPMVLRDPPPGGEGY